MKANAIIVDLDGTLALFEGIRTWQEQKRVGEDKLRASAALITNLYKESGRGDVIIVTGRDASCIKETEYWLQKHHISYDALFMRDEADTRHDIAYKKEVYENQILPHYTIEFVLDDRNSVVEMWRELGLDCYQVALTTY